MKLGMIQSDGKTLFKKQNPLKISTKNYTLQLRKINFKILNLHNDSILDTLILMALEKSEVITIMLSI
jgi:hypothetical protein